MSKMQLWKAILECRYAYTEDEAKAVVRGYKVLVNGKEVEGNIEDQKVRQGDLVDIIGLGQMLI